MASLTIRNLEDAVKRRLRRRAAEHGRSMGEEARQILRHALSGKPSAAKDLFTAIRQRIEPLGGIELALPSRSGMREPPHFEK